ncbi:hypothetical protein RSJ42_05205 [Methanosarcina hadiensis]|uniref:hypothetical protein n=1 Tax=Methanosarcina hadiensis TaxID=3078083 RepID=UPI003977E3A4
MKLLPENTENIIHNENFAVSKILLIAKNHPYIMTFMTFLYSLISFILGWKANNKIADRKLLRDIYSSLHKEIIGMKTNISDYKYCFERIHENVRLALQNEGQYKLISADLRNDIDSYYQQCDEYNKNLKNVKKEIKEIYIHEVQKMRTEEDHKKFLGNNRSYSCFSAPKLLLEGMYESGTIQSENQAYSFIDNYDKWDGVITSEDLIRRSMSLDDFINQLIITVDQNKNVTDFRELQTKLKDPEVLLNKLEKMIRNPNPFIELITDLAPRASNKRKIKNH